MTKATGVLWAVVVTLAWAPDTAAQSGPRPAAAQASMVSASRGLGNAGYTGLGVGGRPSPAADGTPRWADYPVVRAVGQGSPAARVGILPGDVLLLVNGVDARDPRTLFGQPGTVFTMRVRRGSAVREFVLTSIPRPESPPRE